VKKIRAAGFEGQGKGCNQQTGSEKKFTKKQIRGKDGKENGGRTKGGVKKSVGGYP